ncbi:TATA box-binding protein-like 1 [Patiria miniata]|uniref:TATA box-binding protein-like 1 n=1 Tax=Patiria miniata TaxID=46514 RepID=A0A913ZYI7_PATMI|nr:TATA box-binding protein-like 1 [Patiria miniata]XP_038056627.1 TATA box-binding protein-like 1 [Patiria miniata]
MAGDISIKNLMSTFSVCCPLDLKKIGMEGINVEHKNGIVHKRFRNPKATCTIYSSGKVSIMGNNSEEDAKKTARQCARMLQKLGFRVRLNNFKVVNMLGTCTMPFGIKLAQFAKKQPRDKADYEPELHPAVTYRLKSPRATLKIFSTGSITVIAPCVENISQAIKQIYPLVEPHSTKLQEDVIAKKKMKKVKKQTRRKLEDSENTGGGKGSRGGTSSRKDNKSRAPLGVIN